MIALGLRCVTAKPLDQERAVAAHPRTELSGQAVEKPARKKSLLLDALGKEAYLSSDQRRARLNKARSRDQPRGTHS